MGSRRDPGFGIVVLDDRLNSDTLAAKGATTYASAYTEASPQPGHPEPSDEASRWRPAAQGAQSAALTVRTVRGGYPGRGAASASVIYRLATDTDAHDWRSWEEPNLLTDWTTPTDAWASASWDEVTAAVLPDSHRVIVVARHNSDAQTWEYDPRTEAWTSRYDFTSDPGLEKPIALAYDEEGQRLILWSGDGVAGHPDQVAYQSTDGGASWSVYSRGMYDNTVNDSGGPMRVAVAKGLDWLAIMPTATGLDQYASSDRGVSWQRVQSGLSGTLHYPLRSTAGWIIAYVNGSSELCIRQIGSPRSSFSNAAEQVVTTTATQNVVGCRDYDGVLYLYATHTSGNTAVFVSYDDGTTWNAYESTVGNAEYALASASVQPTWRVAVPAAGSVFCVGRHETETKWHACRFGGWSNVEQSTRGSSGALRTGPYRFGAGSTGTDYVALDTPDAYGQWTRVGSAGTRTMNGTDIGFQVSCTQAQVERYQGSTAFSGNWSAGAFCIRVSAGNNLGGTAPTVNSGLIWAITLDNATNEYLAYIEIGADGIRVHDGATQRTSTTLTMSTWTHIRYYMRPGGISVWYRQQGTAKWTRIANNVTITAGVTSGAATNHLNWGHSAAATAGTTTWHTRYVYHAVEGSWRQGIDTLATTDDAYTTGVLGLAYGRRPPGRGAAYPCPELSSSSEDMGYLSAVGGPTSWGEEVSLPVAYTYGIGNVHPDEVPSPRRPWRATGTDEVKIVWEQERASWYGGAIALVVLSADPRELVLEQDDGAGGWTTLATLDKGWTSLGYSFVGRVIQPAISGSVTRYFREGELVGGYFIFPTNTTPVARRIVRQSAGFWTTDTSVQRVRIEVEGADGTEHAGSVGDLVHHSGMIVAYPSTDPARTYLRVRIASGAVTPDGRYQAGILGIGRVVTAPEPAWAWSEETQLSRRATRNSEGALEVVRTGPPRKVLEYGWPDGCFLQELRLLADSPDYFAASGGVALGSEQDAPLTMLGIIEHQLRSGEVPAVVCPRLPAAGTTITDPALFRYGRLLSDAVGIANIVGTEGVNEVLRMDSLAFEQIR